MILVDTSVWINYLRAGEDEMEALLNAGRVLAHPFVVGELACGNLRKRKDVLRLMQQLPRSPVASQEEVLFFIDDNKLMGRGIGFVDAHILAAGALVNTPCIWTCDKRLQRVAADLNLAYQR